MTDNSQECLLLVVAAVLRDRNGRVLIQQRRQGDAHAGLWEFPGGKVEPNETPEIALVRELAEELGVAVDPVRLRPATFARTVAGGRPMVLLLFHALEWTGVPTPLAAAALTWVYPADMAEWPMPPADYPLADHLATMDTLRG